MKKAIGYIRISDKDQSNFSISGQEKYIREYCERHNIYLHSIFTDEKSAKDFDRRAWHKLEDFMRTSYRDVDYLIVIKYDRFSRNAAAGLNKIEMLEKKYRVIVVSVFEQMSIDYDSPFYFKQRADMLVNAEFELRVIRDRTLFGMHEALSSGRYVSKAPTGYLNTRDIYDKPFIVIDRDKGPIIRRMFEMYLQGSPLKAISDYAVMNGFPLKGNSAVTRVLTNPVYAGLVRVPAYKHSPEKVIPGIHDALISTGDFWDIQVRLGVIKQVHTVLNENVPLRGVLKCFCGKPLTAGNSKGKKNYYWYYKCMDHLKFNLSAIKLHRQFCDLLDNLSLDPEYLDYLRSSAEKQMKEEVKFKTTCLSDVLHELDSVTDKLDSLEEKYINNAINPETYQKWYGKLKRSESALKYEKESLQQDRRKYWQLFEEQLPKLSDMKAIYNMATLNQTQAFVKLVFKSELRYQDGVYRTPYLLNLFQPKSLLLKEKRLLDYEKPLQISGVTPVCAPGGT